MPKKYEPLKSKDVFSMPVSPQSTHREHLFKSMTPMNFDNQVLRDSTLLKNFPSVAAGFSNNEFKGRLIKSQGTSRKNTKSQSTLNSRQTIKHFDTVKVLQSLIENPNKMKTVESTRSKLDYIKKAKKGTFKVSPRVFPQQVKKKEGFF